MMAGCARFDRFVLDAGDRRLTADGERVELNPRYFDALALLVREGGKLVSKDRFLDEVWHGVPVTDEALTQCIKTLRRQLGDAAANPRFIETVPKHGYRFIAPVEWVEKDEAAAVGTSQAGRWRRVALLGSAGTVGGGVAGVIGGLFYGLVASGAAQPAMGAVSVLLVLVCVVTLTALIGGAGVGFGIAAAGFAGRAGWWKVAGGALGGLVVGALVKLLGLDAFALLLGRAPDGITGAAEGAVLGGAVGLGAWLGDLAPLHGSLRRRVAAAGLAGGAGGIVTASLGGRLMGGSLDLLARVFPGSQLRLDRVGAMFGERGFGAVAQIATGGLEGVLFGGCIVGAMVMAGQRIGRPEIGSDRLFPR